MAVHGALHIMPEAERSSEALMTLLTPRCEARAMGCLGLPLFSSRTRAPQQRLSGPRWAPKNGRQRTWAGRASYSLHSTCCHHSSLRAPRRARTAQGTCARIPSRTSSATAWARPRARRTRGHQNLGSRGTRRRGTSRCRSSRLRTCAESSRGRQSRAYTSTCHLDMLHAQSSRANTAASNSPHPPTPAYTRTCPCCRGRGLSSRSGTSAAYSRSPSSPRRTHS